MVLYVHKGEAKEISLDEATEVFIVRNERRRTLFGVKKNCVDIWNLHDPIKICAKIIIILFP